MAATFEEIEKFLHQRLVVVLFFVLLFAQAELAAHALEVGIHVKTRESIQHHLRRFGGLGFVIGNEWQQALPEAGQIPLCDGGLIAIGIAAALIDRAVYRG